MVMFFRHGFKPMSSLVQCACKLPEYLYLNVRHWRWEEKGVEILLLGTVLTCTSLKDLWSMSLHGYGDVVIPERNPV